MSECTGWEVEAADCIPTLGQEAEGSWQVTRSPVYLHRVHQLAGQPSPHTWAVLCLHPVTFYPPSTRLTVTHHVPG